MATASYKNLDVNRSWRCNKKIYIGRNIRPHERCLRGEGHLPLPEKY